MSGQQGGPMDNFGYNHHEEKFQKKHWAETNMGYTDPPQVEDDDDGEDKPEPTCTFKKVKDFVVKVFLSYIGSFLLVAGYCVLGGYLFVHLELGNEKSVCVQRVLKYEAKLNESQRRAIAIVQGSIAMNETAVRIRAELDKFAFDVFTLSVDPKLDCDNIGTGEGQTWPGWNLLNSIYFCATIVTTIGYGHISPSTKWGKIVCMIYSFLGMPLLLLFLSNIGEVLADAVKLIYLNLCCCRCFIKRVKEHDEEMPEEDWKTIEPGSDGGPAKGPPAKVPVIVEEYEEEEEEEDGTVNIPITVAVLLIVGYIMIGAALFQIWETDWDLVDGAYFAMITVTTIGFGDLVPGKENQGADHILIELLVGALYCILGLAMLSMCMNLVQDEIAAKFQWVGSKMGCIKKENHEDDEQDEHEQESSHDGHSRRSSLQGSQVNLAQRRMGPQQSQA